MAKTIERLDTLQAPSAAQDRQSQDQDSDQNGEPLAETALGASRTGPDEIRGAAAFPVTSWDKYEFLSLIGRGGMGAVYKARDRRLSRLVALKFLRVDDPEFVARFRQEASTLARFDHPNICHIFEVGQVEGKPYLAMQFIDGRSLDQVHKDLSLHQKVTVIRDVALALHEAHRIGIVHRDVKPSNIMMERLVDGGERAIVMDFGIARESFENRGLTETGSVMGTPAYMSPEQARGRSRSVDRRADIYSLGATLYELLTGVPPFSGAEVVDVILAVLHEEPKPPIQRVAELPRDLDTIVLKCLAKEPSQRYDSARALAEDLQRYIDGEPILGRRAGLIFRLRRKIRNNKPVFALGILTFLITLTLGIMGVRVQLQARQKAQQSQLLGQEIRDMEWMLRSARQLPLHDLNREKIIVRERMERLQARLASYGEGSRALVHYALGRAHMALHEYPQALTELQRARALGLDNADVHYALGLVLGKHYEQAMYEARLSGGGDWAQKQLKELAPKFLQPAIDSLQKSKEQASDVPGYLDALLAYYRKDYPAAMKHAAAALQATPWLYEASKLQGDIHLEQALHVRDTGKDDAAKQEFAAAVREYQEAAKIGQSDAEVYEGLAEAWVRQVEMAATRGQPTDDAYAAAVDSSNKITFAEPTSTAGSLKKAYAALMTMAISGSGTSSSARVQICLTEAQSVLDREPENPYARDVAAACTAFAADSAQGRGEDPEPLFRRAIALLEPAVNRNPRFLWGLNDMASIYLTYGVYLQLRGNGLSRNFLEKSLYYERAAIFLDDKYLIPVQNELFTISRLIDLSETIVGVYNLLGFSDGLFGGCLMRNNQHQQCNINYLTVYSWASRRMFTIGQPMLLLLSRAQETLMRARKLGGSFLDLEQHAVLLSWLNASELVRTKQNPGTSLLEFEQALTKCLALSAEDAMCRTLDAQADWVRADWALEQKQPASPWLERAIKKAHLATRSREVYPDSWQVLAESHLRIARLSGIAIVAREQHIRDGLVALERTFAINPRHALGLVTQGELFLLDADSQRDAVQKQQLAQLASQKFAAAMASDPLLAARYDERRRSAERLAHP